MNERMRIIRNMCCTLYKLNIKLNGNPYLIDLIKALKDTNYDNQSNRMAYISICLEVS